MKAKAFRVKTIRTQPREMNKGDAYCALARLYEKAMDVDYDAWAEYVLGALRTYSPGSVGADVGCGSGAFTRRFRRAGLNVTGFDLSGEMLSAAADFARKEGLNITFVRQDMRFFRPMGKLHFITALTDCLNYVSDEDMFKTFARFSKALVKGGFLMFDISTEYKLKTVIGNNMFGEDAEDYSYIWFNRMFESGVEMDISVFTKRDNGLYSKKDEHHVQYWHGKETVITALENAGFNVLKVEGHLGEKEEKDAQRLNFLAVKK